MKGYQVFFVVLLAVSLVWVTFPQIKTAKAQEPLNITIKPDGSIEPETDLLERNGTTYTFKGDILGSIMVQKSGITIEGAGFSMSQGDITLAGPDLSYRRCSYILVTNTRFFNSSVFTVGASNNSFIGNYFDRGGIQVQGCANITGDLIKHNTFRNYTIFIDYNRYGLDVITENNFFDSQIAVGLSDAPIVEKNYWSNYNGTDTDGDGIGDTPFIAHILDEPIQDDYPLMSPLDLEVIPEFSSLVLLVLGLFVVSGLLMRCRRVFKSIETKKQKTLSAVL
jgi:hypothetical protein